MSLQAIGQSIQHYIPSREQVAGRFSISPPQIARQLNSVAIPALMLYAACNAPGVDAGLLAAAVAYAGANVIGGAMVFAGAALAPVGGAPLVALGAAVITAAPAAGAIALGTPTL